MCFITYESNFPLLNLGWHTILFVSSLKSSTKSPNQILFHRWKCISVAPMFCMQCTCNLSWFLNLMEGQNLYYIFGQQQRFIWQNYTFEAYTWCKHLDFYQIQFSIFSVSCWSRQGTLKKTRTLPFYDIDLI